VFDRIWQQLLILIAALAILFAPLARTYSLHYRLSIRTSSAIYLTFIILLTFALAPGVGKAGDSFRAGRSIAVFLVIASCVPYVVYALGTGDFRWAALLKLTGLPALLVLIYVAIPLKDPRYFCWQDAAAAALLIGVVLSGLLKGVWNVPLNLDFLNRLYLIGLAAGVWSHIRPVAGLGYQFRLSRRIGGQAMLHFAQFAAIALPSSLLLHFTRWNPRWPGFGSFCLTFLEIFLFIALLEELFFRGFLQSLLARTWNRPRAAQLVVACVFGLFHILHAPFPNWRYVALATLAGWFYGGAFRRTGNLTASALVHAAVDTTWRTWFSNR
jgi:membrane protease YdiL (CAAX protease family)